MKRTLAIIVPVVGTSISVPVMAQGGLKGFIKKLGTKLDSMAVRGIDRHYIDAPKKPGQIILRGNINQTIVSMHSEGELYGHTYSANPYLKTTPSQYVGVWVGYRGYGLGYTVNVAGDKGSNLTFGATGGSYGINVRIHSFENSNPSFNLNSQLLTEAERNSWNEVTLTDPISVNTFMTDGYYFFNGKRFSYSAAYDQSAIQKRSAGSLMAGFMYNYTCIDYASQSNGDLIFLMGNLGKVKMWQGSLGVGYAYNWVPVRGLLVNIMAMPMLTIVNKLRAYSFSTNMLELYNDPITHDPTISMEEWDKWYYENIRIVPEGGETYNSGLSIGFDARMSLTYNFERIYLCAYGQFNNIRYHHGSNHGYLNDWFINTSIGFRF